MNPLTPEQIMHFKQHGYVVLENFIDAAAIDDWRSQIWHTLGTSYDTPQAWPGNSHALSGFHFAEVSAPTHYPRLRAIVEQLGGDAFGRGPDDHGGGGAPIIKWPHPETAWQMPDSGHIDGYPPPDGWAPFMVGMTTYLYDVESHGGAFIYWPDSHLTTHRYFLEHPEQVDGSFRAIEGRGGVFSEIAPQPPREFIAPAGTALLWHAYLCHNGSKNVRSTPRFGLVVRYSHCRTEEEAFRYDVPDDLWKYWAI